MLQCPQCGRQFGSDASVCPEDGTPLCAGSTVDTDAPKDPLVGRVLDEKYRLDSRLGEGGMGTVYRATHLLIERPVAVKVLNSRLVTDETSKERFRREARAAGRLQHTNAVTVTDFGETREGLVYIVMELLEGKPLRDILAREAPLDPARAVSLMLQVSAAVEAAHEAGIIHRDLKPGNIFLVQRPDAPYIVKVLDFGIAKTATDSSDLGAHDTLTGTGVMIGTPRYMSPEQCDGAPLTPASDVYSLGVILYEMLTGQTPFNGATPLSLALKHSSEAPRPPRETVPGIPPALEAVVLRALEKSPQERPRDAGEFRRELFSVAERLGLEHSAGFSAPTIETLRDAGTETPSGRLIIDIERLRRSRAANHTGGAGVPTTDDEIRDTSGRPHITQSLSGSGADEQSANAVSRIEPVAATDAGSSASKGAAYASESTDKLVRESWMPGWLNSELVRTLTRPQVLAVILVSALVIVFGSLMLWRSTGRRAGGTSGAARQADDADETMGRTLSSADSSPRGSPVQQPQTAAEFYDNGTYLFSVRSYDAAIKNFQQAVALQPDFPSAHNRLGRTLMLKGQFAAATEEFRKAIEQRGGNYPVAQYNLGFALQQQGENEKSLAAYRDAIASSGGNYADAYYQTGVVLGNMQRWPEAADALRKAIEQSGGRDPDSQLRLGVALAQQKDYAGAESAFREAADERGGDFAFAHYNLGLLYEQADRPDEAIKEFETFLKQSPNDANRFRVENTLRDLRRRAARGADKNQGGVQTNSNR
ncbi:MAG TPA: serine/threonine-protein kinase [Pyrinomonadaceae bacterium]|nr:serine/threonine-protein kinase [Pyrinomonadaceae bacterium]